MISSLVTEGDKANLRAAWSLEGSILGDEMGDNITVNLLEILEPTLDGFERIVAAMEHTGDATFFFEWAFWRWVRNVDPRAFIETFEQLELRLWRAVESWDSPSRAFDALYAAIAEGFDDWMEYASHAREMTADWTDKSKRDVVIAKFQDVTDRLQEEFDEDYMEEHGWKYEGCPPGVKFWEMDDYDPGDESPPTD